MVGVRWMRLRVAQLDQLPEVYLEPAELNHVSCGNTVTLPKLLGCDAHSSKTDLHCLPTWFSGLVHLMKEQFTTLIVFIPVLNEALLPDTIWSSLFGR